MSQYGIPDPEELIQCPYDKVHMVRAKRLPYHLMKCRKNWTGKEYAVCPFNARHEMPKPELRYHMLRCENRHMIEQDVYATASEDGVFKGNTDVPAYNKWTPPPSYEDWESESFAPRIGVSRDVLDNPKVFRTTTGQKPANKKQYYEKLKRRAQGLPDLDEESTAAPSAAADRAPRTVTGLRLPRTAPVAAGNAMPPSQNAMEPQVFAYSLSMAGIGRGRPVTQGDSSSVGHGRHLSAEDGAGRGSPSGEPHDHGHGHTVVNQQQNDGGPSRPRIAANFSSEQQHVMNGYGGRPVGQEESVLLNGLGRGRGSLYNLTDSLTQVAQPIVFSMKPPPGLGRGTVIQDQQQAGPSFVIPMMNGNSINVKASCPPGFSPLPVGSDEKDKTDEASDSNRGLDSCAEELKKERRKVQKKLKQIQELEEKQASGEKLNQDQQDKIAKKAELWEELKKLCVN